MASRNIFARSVVFLCVIWFVFMVSLLLSLVVVSLLMAALYVFFEPDFRLVFKCVGIPLALVLSARWIYKNLARVKDFANG